MLISIKEFARLYFEREQNTKIKILKAMDAAFLDPQSAEEREIKACIEAFNGDQAAKLEQDVFKQAKRRANAQRSLEVKETKKAADDLRISTDKIARALLRIEDLSRTDPKDRDARIFPGVPGARPAADRLQRRCRHR